MRKLPRYRYCFVCGRNNQAGTDVIWIDTGEGVIGEYWANKKHISYEGIIHGGILSALLDEGIGWAVALKERKWLVTRGLNVIFNQPVPVGKKVTVKGFWSNDQPIDKKYRTGNGIVIDDEGIVYASGEGKYFPVSEEFELNLMKLLEIPDDTTKEVTIEDIWGSP